MNEDVRSQLWGIDELASFLRKHKTSLYSDLRRNPGAVPPPIRLPGSSRLLWDPDFVKGWVRQFQTGDLPQPMEPTGGSAPGSPAPLGMLVPTKRGRGRPRKMEIVELSHG